MDLEILDQLTALIEEAVISRQRRAEGSDDRQGEDCNQARHFADALRWSVVLGTYCQIAAPNAQRAA